MVTYTIVVTSISETAAPDVVAEDHEADLADCSIGSFPNSAHASASNAPKDACGAEVATWLCQITDHGRTDHDFY